MGTRVHTTTPTGTDTHRHTQTHTHTRHTHTHKTHTDTLVCNNDAPYCFSLVAIFFLGGHIAARNVARQRMPHPLSRQWQSLPHPYFFVCVLSLYAALLLLHTMLLFFVPHPIALLLRCLFVRSSILFLTH